MVQCTKCKKEVSEDDTMESDNGLVCDKCAVKYFVQCDGCGLIITKKPIEIDGYELCKDCADDWDEEGEWDDEDEWDDDEDEDY